MGGEGGRERERQKRTSGGDRQRERTEGVVGETRRAGGLRGFELSMCESSEEKGSGRRERG